MQKNYLELISLMIQNAFYNFYWIQMDLTNLYGIKTGELDLFCILASHMLAY